MQYIAGLAIVGMLIQGNVLAALAVALFFLLAYAAFRAVMGVGDTASLRSTCSSLRESLGSDWVLLLCEDDWGRVPIGIVFHPKTKDARIVSRPTASDVPAPVDIGPIQMVEMKERHPEAIFQPCATVKFQFESGERILRVTGRSNWKVLQDNWQLVAE